MHSETLLSAQQCALALSTAASRRGRGWCQHQQPTWVLRSFLPVHNVADVVTCAQSLTRSQHSAKPRHWGTHGQGFTENQLVSQCVAGALSRNAQFLLSTKQSLFGVVAHSQCRDWPFTKTEHNNLQTETPPRPALHVPALVHMRATSEVRGALCFGPAATTARDDLPVRSCTLL